MGYLVLKGKILLRCSQPSILPTKNITRQVFLFDGLAWKRISTQIVFTSIIIRLNEKYLSICDRAWKHPVYIVSQTEYLTNIFICRSGLKTRFQKDCRHSSYQMLKRNVFLVSWPGLKMYCKVYIISHKCATNILFDGQAWKHSIEIIGYNKIFLLCKCHTLEWEYLLFHGLVWNHFAVFIIRQTSLTVRLKNMISSKQKFPIFQI